MPLSGTNRTVTFHPYSFSFVVLWRFRTVARPDGSQAVSMNLRVPFECQLTTSAWVGMSVSWRPNPLKYLKTLVIQMLKHRAFRTELELSNQMSSLTSKAKNIDPRARSGHMNVFQANYTNPNRCLRMNFPVCHQLRPPVWCIGNGGGAVVGQRDPISQMKRECDSARGIIERPQLVRVRFPDVNRRILEVESSDVCAVLTPHRSRKGDRQNNSYGCPKHERIIALFGVRAVSPSMRNFDRSSPGRALWQSELDRPGSKALYPAVVPYH